MKKIIIAAAVFIGGIIYQQEAKAQIRLNINIGSQPDWGPAGYDHVDYYYLPDVGAYYDVPAHEYVYQENSAWVRRTYLPARYNNYNIYNGYKVVINERRPWLRDNIYRTEYANYRGRTGQVIIRDSRDVKYRDHWMDKADKKQFKREEKEQRKEMKRYEKDRKHGFRDED
ncbi:hypothetical protein [Mucilaginibacter sp.]|uniref:hypothetical protein n=1 Tax=Mucilaginibacter sp. TaxID=1882438 RepID=UPI000CA7C387|nr:hypothetical protein [Mucilaginibacter sp.]PLW91612.1 MAG: hypothetical protein C0154_00250 [Mucilaginibacter sp.]HEK18862.1 hypothetical protein [Bacteroidota bacterium]